MRRGNLLTLWVSIGIFSGAGSAMALNSVEDQVRKLGERYNQIEAQLDRSVHYQNNTDSNGATMTEQAWFDGAGDLIKVSTEHSNGSARELTEYIALDFENDYDGMFVLVRKETPSPDGGTRVDESRKYFGENKGGNGQLIRELRKSAQFKAGQSTDTLHITNATVDLTKKSNQMSEDELRELMLAPEEIAKKLREAGSLVTNPFASIKGDSEKFRVIHGTASPDGRYAIALGFAGDQVKWDEYLDSDSEDGSYRAEGADGIRNYVVDLTQQKILGETGQAWDGTRRRYNHPECIVTWSPDSTVFVQLLNNKWSSDGCAAGRIASGPKFLGTVDLIKVLSQKTYAFAKKPFDPKEGGFLRFSINRLSNDGVIDLEAAEYHASGARKGDTIFAVSERLRLQDNPNGLRLDVVNMRRLPNEQ